MSDTINAAGLALIKSFEGLCLTATKCAAVVWTIGYGHTGKVDGKSISSGMIITQSKADSLLAEDVAKFWAYANNTAYVPMAKSMNANRLSALTSFAFNCGKGNLKTLCADQSSAESAEVLLLYNKAGDKVLSGLTRRRKAERELYLTEVTHGMDTLKKGDEGQQITVLQILLTTSLGCGLDIDGIFGARTKAAVEQYQEAQGLDVDGICGTKTWANILAV